MNQYGIKRRIYAGIGSRETPPDILRVMTETARNLSRGGWLLRSGHAQGADQAFAAGAKHKEIWLPWLGFNGATHDARAGYRAITPDNQVFEIAKAHHPNWLNLSPQARLLHMRNVYQILGRDCQTPADMVVCWTPGGSGRGGTGQAIRIAATYDIPVFDLAIKHDWAALDAFHDRLMAS